MVQLLKSKGQSWGQHGTFGCGNDGSDPQPRHPEVVRFERNLRRARRRRHDNIMHDQNLMHKTGEDVALVSEAMKNPPLPETIRTSLHIREIMPSLYGDTGLGHNAFGPRTRKCYSYNSSLDVWEANQEFQVYSVVIMLKAIMRSNIKLRQLDLDDPPLKFGLPGTKPPRNVRGNA